jgi:hypothetical protein
MRSLLFLLSFIFTTTFAVAQESKKNELKVKINHYWRVPSASGLTNGEKRVFQFNYDTKEVLQITKSPERFDQDIFIRKREDIAKVKDWCETLIKFTETIHDNKITGIKKEWKDKEKWFHGFDIAPMVDRSETADPNYIENIRIRMSFKGAESYFRVDIHDLRELVKCIDERSKEVYKKYDVLKALND